jgi:hypothetical protein
MITIEYKKLKDLSIKEITLMNRARIDNFGKNETKDWKKEYPSNSIAFFVKSNSKIMSFLVLIPITINYLRKRYNILGICSVISVDKGKGYGLLLIDSVLSYIKKTKKSALGFTTKTEFFRKAGLEIKKELIKRFIYIDPITKEKIKDDIGDGIFYNGKDNFIKKVLSTKSKVIIPILHW